jgi:hypothetical protein
MVGLATAAAPSEAAFPGYNGKLLVGQGPWYAGIGTIYPNGARISLLVNGDDYNGAWSPDGTKVAYNENGTDETPGRTYILDVATGTTTRLPDDYYDPAWSPDGTKLVFDGGRVANADGTVGTPIPNVGGEPAWSPDGTKIAFARSVASGYDIYTVNADGSGFTALTNDGAQYNELPDWSPDSTKLTYVRSNAKQIWRMNSDGSGQAQVTPSSSPAITTSPVWSPDGTKIAYSTCNYFNGSCITRIVTLGISNSVITTTAGGGLDWQSCATPCPPPPPPPYDAPQAATKLMVPLVPNFRQTISSTQCTARGGLNSTHGEPLSLPSCNPPAFLPGTVAHFGPNHEYIPSYARLTTMYGDDNLADGDQADVTIGTGIFDIETATGDPYLANPAGAELTLVLKLRLTDSYNGASLDVPATVADFELGIPVDCVQYAPGRESACNGYTSIDALQPGLIRENGATVIQTYIARVKDSGLNGIRGDSDDRQFGMQGYTVALRTPG